MTIAANMGDNVPPEHILFCIRHCYKTFLIQILIAVFFVYENLDFKNF